MSSPNSSPTNSPTDSQTNTPVRRGIDISGLSFRSLRENDAEYVDKSFLIEQILLERSGVLLLPRPRRFGKSINMEMLYEFFARENAPSEHLFEGLYLKSIWEKVQPHFRRYPTLLLTLKELKPSAFEDWHERLSAMLGELVRKHAYLLPVLTPEEQVDFQALLQRNASTGVMARSLRLLCEWLYRFHGEKVVIIIDEYDAPIQEAWLLTERALPKGPELCPGILKPDGSTLYSVVISFFRTFFGAAFKGNPLLFKGILTGILRVSRESIFSDLNNIDVYTMLSRHYWNAFGFTEAEVADLFERQQQTERLPLARRWYNGYKFGGETIYNPLSVMKFLKEEGQPPQAYWIGSSDNALIRHMLEDRALTYHDDFQTLLAGQWLEVPVIDNLSLPELATSTEALYSLLLFAGYLKAELIGIDGDGAGRYAVSIPNLEVAQLYRRTFTHWLGGLLPGGDTRAVEHLQKALLTGQEDAVQRMLSDLALKLLSFQDGQGRDPEAFYHGLLLGLFASLQSRFRVESNREAGLGRADLLIAPREAGQPGAVLELKVARKGKKSLTKALAEGEAQQRDRLYATNLEAAGAHPIHRWVVAFDGKVVKVRLVGQA